MPIRWMSSVGRSASMRMDRCSRLGRRRKVGLRLVWVAVRFRTLTSTTWGRSTCTEGVCPSKQLTGSKMKLMSAAVLSLVALISACGGGGGGSDDGGVPPVVLEPNKVVLLNEDGEPGRRKLVAVDVGSGARVVLDSGGAG